MKPPDVGARSLYVESVVRYSAIFRRLIESTLEEVLAEPSDLPVRSYGLGESTIPLSRLSSQKSQHYKRVILFSASPSKITKNATVPKTLLWGNRFHFNKSDGSYLDDAC